MRLTVLSQYARGVAHHDKAEGARLLASLDSIKWLLWHGNQYGDALEFLQRCTLSADLGPSRSAYPIVPKK